jgi:hypothetical protein
LTSTAWSFGAARLIHVASVLLVVVDAAGGNARVTDATETTGDRIEEEMW